MMNDALTVYPSLEGVDTSMLVPMADVGQILSGLHSDYGSDIPECLDLGDVIDIAARTGVDEEALEGAIRSYITDRVARVSEKVSPKAAELEDMLVHAYMRMNVDRCKAVSAVRFNKERDDDRRRNEQIEYELERSGECLDIRARYYYEGHYYYPESSHRYWAYDRQRLFEARVRPKKTGYDIRFNVRDIGKGDSEWFLMWAAQADEASTYLERVAAIAVKSMKQGIKEAIGNSTGNLDGFSFDIDG